MCSLDYTQCLLLLLLPHTLASKQSSDFLSTLPTPLLSIQAYLLPSRYVSAGLTLTLADRIGAEQRRWLNFYFLSVRYFTIYSLQSTITLQKFSSFYKWIEVINAAILINHITACESANKFVFPLSAQWSGIDLHQLITGRGTRDVSAKSKHGRLAFPPTSPSAPSCCQHIVLLINASGAVQLHEAI